MSREIDNLNAIDPHEIGDPCPRHGSPHHKAYTFGSTMTAETEICTFRGCGCAVSISHDPVGTYQAVSKYHISYDNAAGVGRLRAADWAAKLR